MIQALQGRSGRLWLTAAACIFAAAATSRIEPPGFTAEDAADAAKFAAFASAAIVAVLIFPLAVWRTAIHRKFCLTIAIVTAAFGIAAYVTSDRIQRLCTAEYDGRLVVVGSELSAYGQKYVAANPTQSREENLFDARGVPETLWTRESIDRCTQQIGATYFLWIPLLVASVLAAVQSASSNVLAVRTTAEPRPPAIRPSVPERYDAFISYRHGGLDGQIARQLLEILEADGYRIAIDERDFFANASFLEEMERCIRESRFTIAIVSPRYLESGNCQEEAIISKVLDMEERRRRLIPFVIEPTTMPAWLYGIVGIPASTLDALVDPIEKLKATLGAPAAFN